MDMTHIDPEIFGHIFGTEMKNTLEQNEAEKLAEIVKHANRVDDREQGVTESSNKHPLEKPTRPQTEASSTKIDEEPTVESNMQYEGSPISPSEQSADQREGNSQSKKYPHGGDILTEEAFVSEPAADQSRMKRRNSKPLKIRVFVMPRSAKKTLKKHKAIDDKADKSFGSKQRSAQSEASPANATPKRVKIGHLIVTKNLELFDDEESKVCEWTINYKPENSGANVSFCAVGVHLKDFQDGKNSDHNQQVNFVWCTGFTVCVYTDCFLVFFCLFSVDLSLYIS